MLTFFTLYCIFGITVVIYCIFTDKIFNIHKFKIYESKVDKDYKFATKIKIDFIFEKRDLWIFLYWNKISNIDLTTTLELYFAVFPTLVFKMTIITDDLSDIKDIGGLA